MTFKILLRKIWTESNNQFYLALIFIFVFLGWEIHSEFRRILQLIQFRTFWTLEFSSEFYFSDRKMCSR